MGLRRYLKINQLLSKLEILDKTIDESISSEIKLQTNLVCEKIDNLLSGEFERDSEIKELIRKISSLTTKNNDILYKKTGDIAAKASDLVINTGSLLAKTDDIIFKIADSSTEIENSHRKIKNIEEKIEQFLNNKLEKELNGKLEKIYNKIADLDNDVNKKDYIITDDRLNIIKNLIADERAQHIVLNMEFDGAGLSLRIDDSDIRVFKQIFVDNEYDSLNLPETAKTIIDLGANIGLSALFFIKKYPDASIVAVEPDAVNFSIMEKNLKKFSESISFLQAAIWPTDGEVSLVEEDDNHASLGAWGYRTEASNGNSTLSVKALSIPTIMKQYDMEFVDILKVDIEGAEYELFEKNYEDWIDKVGLIIIETHDRFKPNSEAMVRRALNGRFNELPMKGENLFFKKK
ncbi:FkbM family methyltransferase [uncultured Bartonella sp.]|uniref:FkbM family methyltransferase n=1 Tax=uncultured Bartonella sp. TaxID=104108 RepID=UPI0025CF2E89|nr:FkbM family methyltransferase [uncultured Bartonella sp.]